MGDVAWFFFKLASTPAGQVVLGALVVAVWWCVLVVCFMAVMHAKRVLDSGKKISMPFLVPVVLAGVLGYALDIGFNVLLGGIIFRELALLARVRDVSGLKAIARALTFTARCSYHKRNSQGWRQSLAQRLCGQMDNFDPGHCDA